MKFVKSNWITIVLTLVAIILGIMLVLKYLPNIKLPSIQDKSAITTPKPQNDQASQNISPVPDFIKKLSLNEQKILNVPPLSAPIEERKAHYDLVRKMAVDAEYLELADCRPVKPLVMKVQAGKKILVKNSSSVEHTIYLNKDTSYTVKAKDSQEIDYDFSKGNGVYGYGCDHTPYPIGFFMVSGSTATPTTSN